MSFKEAMQTKYCVTADSKIQFKLRPGVPGSKNSNGYVLLNGKSVGSWRTLIYHGDSQFRVALYGIDKEEVFLLKADPAAPDHLAFRDSEKEAKVSATKWILENLDKAKKNIEDNRVDPWDDQLNNVQLAWEKLKRIPVPAGKQELFDSIDRVMPKRR